MPTAKIDLTGQRFGHLTVICPSELNGNGNRFNIDAAALYRRLYRGLPVEKVFAIAASKGA